MHASLLPRHRGAAPVSAAILAGDVETGVTIMLMDEGLDTGPILSQRSLPLTGEGRRLASLTVAHCLTSVPTCYDPNNGRLG